MASAAVALQVARGFMRHGPGSPPPCSARDSGEGWEKAGSGRCSDGEAWAWPLSGAAPPKCWAFQALAGSVYPLCVSPTLPALVAGLGGNRCAHHRGQKSLAPSASATPRSCHLFFLPTPANASRSPASIAIARASLRAMHTLHSEFRVPRDLLHSLHSELRIPLGFCTSSILCPSRP